MSKGIKNLCLIIILQRCRAARPDILLKNCFDLINLGLIKDNKLKHPKQ